MGSWGNELLLIGLPSKPPAVLRRRSRSSSNKFLRGPRSNIFFVGLVLWAHNLCESCKTSVTAIVMSARSVGRSFPRARGASAICFPQSDQPPVRRRHPLRAVTPPVKSQHINNTRRSQITTTWKPRHCNILPATRHLHFRASHTFIPVHAGL